MFCLSLIAEQYLLVDFQPMTGLDKEMEHCDWLKTEFWFDDFRVKQRLHEMMCSQEEPTGEFLDKLIPTGSASMKNAIEKIRKPLMQMLQVRIEKFPCTRVFMVSL